TGGLGARRGDRLGLGARAADHEGKKQRRQSRLHGADSTTLIAMARRSVVAAIALVAALAARARAGDPERGWRTFEREAFVITYYARPDGAPHRIAAVAERAPRTLAPALDHEPAEKTQIVIIDDTDGANGFANVLPRNTITLFATAPGGTSDLSDHDDWLLGL